MGADSVRTSNIRDHACRNQHIIHVMSIHCKMADGSYISSEPIIFSMLQEIPEDAKSKLRNSILHNLLLLKS